MNTVTTMGVMRLKPERYVGKRFGRLLVTGIDSDPSRSDNKHRMACLCDCGTETIVRAADLRTGDTSSCGCLHRELASGMGKKRKKHGHSVHGAMVGGETPIYMAWMKVFLCIRNFRNRAAAGSKSRSSIEIDPRWAKFENFLADFGPIEVGQTITRRNRKLPYNKANCFINFGYPQPRRALKVGAGSTSYGCYNRAPFTPSYALTGGGTQKNFSEGKPCEYTKSALGQADKGCAGCKWRQDHQPPDKLPN